MGTVVLEFPNRCDMRQLVTDSQFPVLCQAGRYKAQVLSHPLQSPIKPYAVHYKSPLLYDPLHCPILVLSDTKPNVPHVRGFVWWQEVCSSMVCISMSIIHMLTGWLFIGVPVTC